MKTLTFSGHNKSDSLILGNHEDIKLSISGDFDLSGLVLCNRYSINIIVSGNGKLALHGVCKNLTIRRAEGDCFIDLRNLTIRELSCEMARGNAKIIAGVVKKIPFVKAEQNAEFLYSRRTLCIFSHANENARIESYHNNAVTA